MRLRARIGTVYAQVRNALNAGANAVFATATIATAAVTTLSLGGIAIAVITRPPQITAHQLNSADWGSTLFTVLTSNAPYNLDGVAGAALQWRFVVNGNAADAFTFVNNGSGTNKYRCPGGANHVLLAGHAALLIYDPAASPAAGWLVIPF